MPSQWTTARRIEKGYDEKYGARPLRRTIQTYLEDKLAEAILEGAVKKDEEVLVTRENDALKFSSPVAANL